MGKHVLAIPEDSSEMSLEVKFRNDPEDKYSYIFVGHCPFAWGRTLLTVYTEPNNSYHFPIHTIQCVNIVQKDVVLDSFIFDCVDK